MILTAGFSLAEACQLSGPELPSSNLFYRHILGPCTFEEREALAISGDELFRALSDGKNVDLLGMVVVGDVLLNQLPLHPLKSQPITSPRIQQALEKTSVGEVRVIPGSFILRESWFQGTIGTNLKNGALVVFGLLDMTGTKFERSVDFSRTFFQNAVNFSNSSIGFEGFFIGAHFDRGANFSGMSFGLHSRFHKAFFGGKTTFAQARFDGLSEFLEVIFENDVNFSETDFHQGTGFSGTEFRGDLIFTDSLFEREVYFRFASFHQHASFERTTFKEVADFTSIQYEERPDFTNTIFRLPPTVSDSTIDFGNQTNKKLNNPRIQIIIFVGLVLFVLLVLWGNRSSKNKR